MPELELDGLRVLVVDDEQDACELTAFVLGAAGAQVDTVNSAKGALRRLDAERFDVVVSDISMPEMDGYAFARELSTRPHKQPTLALTSLTSKADRRRALAAGFDAHLGKSADTETLRRAVWALAKQPSEQLASPAGD